MAFENNTSPLDCNKTVTKLFENFSSASLDKIVTKDNLTNLLYFCAKGFESEENEKFNEPLVWIGVYMAVASFVCILCMGADAGTWKERYQIISSKFTSLNTASMMVITVVMKLTVDMTGSMPSNLDQMAKIGSIAFMCTILAILNPSLASMSNKTLLANIIGLVIFIVTIAVNLCIEIDTGVIRNNDAGPKSHISIENGEWEVVAVEYSFDFANVASAYIGIMILLLLISISTAINIPSFKKILEFKYQEKRNTIKDDQQHPRIPTVGELTQHVTKYWIMAKTGSPQFAMACNSLSYSSLVLCVVSMGLCIWMLASLVKNNAYDKKLESDYKWSISVILWTQVTGSIIGTLLVTFRCIRSMKFIKVSWEFADLFNLKEEKYWTQRLSEWKGSHIGFQSSDPRSRTSNIAHFMKNRGLGLLGRLQKILDVLNRVLASICFGCLKLIIIVSDGLRSTTPVVSSDIKDPENYVLLLDDKAQPSQEFLEIISKSMKHLIESAKKKQNVNLLELLGKSNGFKGVASFDDIDQNFGFNDLHPSVRLNSWSVPVITLSSIAIAVPGIGKDQVKSLIQSIDEALLYTRHVDKSFKSAREYANIRKTAITLWCEVRSKRKWLDQKPNILDSFATEAEVILEKAELIMKETTGFPIELIAAHSMHRITRSILFKYPDGIQTNELFFEHLCSMIADILVACFSNLPQVIKMKCHADEIEKREASVEAAVKLLGRTTEIIRKLEACELPSMDPEKMGSIDEWRLHLKQSSIP